MDQFVNNTTVADHVMGAMPFMKHSPLVAAVFTAFYVVIFVLGVTGNLLVCVVVIKDRSMRTVTNYFIVNLAVSDLLVMLICLPVTLVENLLTGWRFGQAMCKLYPVIQGATVGASLFTLVAIAADRYKAVLHATSKKLSGCSTLCVVAVVWVLALAIMIPQGLVRRENWYYLTDGNNVVTCTEKWLNEIYRKLYFGSLFMICYAIPLIVAIVLYVRIGYRIRKPRRSFHLSSSPQRARVSARKVAVIKMLATVVVLFAVLWLPLQTVFMVLEFATITEAQEYVIFVYVYPIAHWLTYLNSALNPVVYGYFNNNFREAFHGLIATWRKNIGLDSMRKKAFIMSRRLTRTTKTPTSPTQQIQLTTIN
ncbi:PREDICTED: neuropeptide FF receptor 1-like [Branchiostoma belcheri]|uniref:Neuropeptide FF receptor 1-like n=1 Tax=Branchiostoma belcheri TaxID=7741 RepID=A0A6P4XD29_BRABE|nr:PREDICTED: neuropeptide FF receptor 1-like [Branchiostoma belcheri]